VKLNNKSIYSKFKIRKNTNIDSKSNDEIYYDGIGELVPSMDKLVTLLSDKPPDIKEKILRMMLNGLFHHRIQSYPLKKIYLCLKI
jgi:hypothetical protein